MSKHVAINLRNIPKPLRDKFKALCAQKGTYMQDELVEMIRNACKEATRGVSGAAKKS